MAAFWTECYQRLFQKRLHKPFDIQVYHDHEGFSLKLAIHDQAARNYRVYASLGLADKLADRDEDSVGEVILFSDVADREVPELLVQTLFFILHHAIPLRSRFAIGIEQMHARFADRYQKSALYFTLSPEEEGSSNLVRNGEEFGRVYEAFFIAPQEHRYLEESGADAFEEKLFHQEGGFRGIRRAAIG